LWRGISGVVCKAIASQTVITRSSDSPWRSRKARAAFASKRSCSERWPLDEADVVEHRADVERLGVVVQAELLPL
jgi:hypothetical protein